MAETQTTIIEQGNAATGGFTPPNTNEQQSNPPVGQESNSLLTGGNIDAGKEQTGEDAEKPVGAPEKYEFKAPEGFELDTELVEQFTPVAKELNLTNDQAQKLVDLYADKIKAQQNANNEAWIATLDGWASSVKTDKEMGGPALENNLVAARNALEKYGTPELKAVMNPPSPQNPKGLGLGNHPEIIRVLARIGKAMGEDQTYLRNEPPHEDVAPAKRMFPNMA